MTNTKNNLRLTCLASAAFLLTLSACSFSEKAAHRLYNKAATQTYDMVIVPGLPLEDSLQWGRIMKGRVYWAKFLYDKGIAKNIMFSGSAVYTPYYEGIIMALYAEAIGVPKEHIFSETMAEHSTENLYYSYKKAKKLGFNTIALASDPFQSKQLRSFAHLRLSRSIGIIPFVIDTLKRIEPTMQNPAIDFHKADAPKNFVPLPKRQGWWKRFKGTLGWNRNRNAYE
jgi:uncharacterized SAM-binding protein YcdF (DUF218 family)